MQTYGEGQQVRGARRDLRLPCSAARWGHGWRVRVSGSSSCSNLYEMLTLLDTVCKKKVYAEDVQVWIQDRDQGRTRSG